MSKEKFHDELDILKKDVTKMGELARDMLVDSVRSLKDQNLTLAREIQNRERVLRGMDCEIEMKALKLVTLHQPMAKDMRTIACILKMDTYLTRVGRYGYDIARITIDIANGTHIAKLVSIPHVTDIVKGMLDDSLKAFNEEDMKYLERFDERDDDVDALRYSIFRECVTYMIEDPKTIKKCSNYIMVVRYLERCGDLACKIAEKVTYMLTGDHACIIGGGEKVRSE